MQLIGKILSTHGVKGQVIFEHTLKNYSDFISWDALLIELLPGSQIPFFIEDIKKQQDNSCLVKLEEYDAPEATHEIMGKNVYLSPNIDASKIDTPTVADSFIGYTLFSDEKEVGRVDNILNPKTNPLFIIHEDTDNELLIPANEELILEIDIKAKKIVLEIADGLLD